MNVPIDVVATFNTKGEIRPDYVRLQGNDNMLYTYKVSVEYTKEEKYAGIRTLYFRCIIIENGIKKQLIIIYNIENHQWLISSPYNGTHVL